MTQQLTALILGFLGFWTGFAIVGYNCERKYVYGDKWNAGTVIIVIIGLIMVIVGLWIVLTGASAFDDHPKKMTTKMELVSR